MLVNPFLLLLGLALAIVGNVAAIVANPPMAASNATAVVVCVFAAALVNARRKGARR